MPIRVQEVVFDCADPIRLARFWAEILDARWAAMGSDWTIVEAEPILVAFQRVPEPKSSPKNRLHLDIEVPNAAAAIERAIALGARPIGDPQLDAHGDGYAVMADPEDNEFCFVVDAPGAWTATLRRALDAGAHP